LRVFAIRRLAPDSLARNAHRAVSQAVNLQLSAQLECLAYRGRSRHHESPSVPWMGAGRFGIHLHQFGIHMHFSGHSVCARPPESAAASVHPALTNSTPPAAKDSAESSPLWDGYAAMAPPDTAAAAAAKALPHESIHGAETPPTQWPHRPSADDAAAPESSSRAPAAQNADHRR